MLDCPLRDEPFSIDSPLIDVFLSEQATAVVESALPQVEALPPFMRKTDAPAFGAIMSLRSAAPMAGIPPGALADVDAELRALPVTDADRRARCARYDDDRPTTEVPDSGTRILLFEKINGFDHGPSVGAATNAVRAIADDLGWFVAVTERGGAFHDDYLAKFDAVVWNNNSGDVLTLSQRAAFENYIKGGGGFLGLHGAGGDSVYFWDWYRDELLGAQFIGHPTDPQFQDADIRIEASSSGIAASLAPGWTMNDEWYSFARSARDDGADVVATLDESTYSLEGFMGQDIAMGDDHPIVWTRCVGNGRAMYSAIGHRPEVYDVAEYTTLLRDGLRWAAGHTPSRCESD